MKIDYSSGLVLSNGDLLEATYREPLSFNGIMIEMKRVYTGCYITKPDGQKIWYANSWFTEIEPLEP